MPNVQIGSAHQALQRTMRYHGVKNVTNQRTDLAFLGVGYPSGFCRGANWSLGEEDFGRHATADLGKILGVNGSFTQPRLGSVNGSKQRATITESPQFQVLD